jgi:hypothetical protein
MKIGALTYATWHIVTSIVLTLYGLWWCSFTWDHRAGMTYPEKVLAVFISMSFLVIAVVVLKLGKTLSRRIWHLQQAERFTHPAAKEHAEAHEADAFKVQRQGERVAFIIVGIGTLIMLALLIVPALRML